MTFRRDRDRRRAAGLLASFVAHAVAVGLLASVAPPLVLTQGRPEALQVRLVAAPADEGVAVPRLAAAGPTRSPREALREALPASRPLPPALHARTAPPPRTRPAAPAAPRPGGGAAAGAAGTSPKPAGRAPGPQATDGGDAEGAARALVRTTVGCDHETWLRLSPAERERCDVPFVEGLRSGLHIDPLPADKRADFDRQAAADSRRRTLREGPLYNPAPACTGAGSNFGTGCLAEDAVGHLRPR